MWKSRKLPKGDIARSAAVFVSVASVTSALLVGTSAASTSLKSPAVPVPASTKKACAAMVAKYPTAAHKSFNVGISASGAGTTIVNTKSPYGYSGLNPDTAEAIAQCLSDKVKFTNFTFDGLIPGLAAGHVQMVIGGQYDTPEREKQVTFIDYLGVKEIGIVAKGNPKHIETMDDLCGKTVVETAGEEEVTIIQNQSAKCTSAGKPAINLIQYTDGSQVSAALLTHRADFELNSTSAIETLQNQYPGKVQQTLKPQRGPVDGIELRKNDKADIHAVAGAMGILQKVGWEKKLIAKYLPTSGDVVVRPVINGGKNLVEGA